ncbi:hypothetical protein L6R53_01060 [Myxococcota bacterium]|nr:hypothetical protein [Myxococcota bacterium]
MPRSLTLLLLAICLLLAPGLATASTWSTPHVATIRDAEVLSWHPTGKPTSIQGDDFIEVTYDHAGRRSVVRWCETDSTCTGDETYDLYLYDPDGRVLARLQSPAADTRPLLQELYIYAGGQLLGFLDFSSGWSNGRPFWVHTDLQGSLRLVTDASGEAMQELRWSPMGTLLSTSAPMLQDALGFAWQPLAYRGVPVVDVGARVRHAEYGWFLSPDPVAWGDPSDPQTFHRSQYARGNPMTYVDPWGEWAVPVGVVAAAAFTYKALDVAATAVDVYGTAETGWRYSQGQASEWELGTSAFATGLGVAAPLGGAAFFKSKAGRSVLVKIAGFRTAGRPAALTTLEGVPWGRYCASGCEDVAARIRGAIGGEIKTLRPTLPRAQTLGPRAGVGDTYWATHEVVVKDGTVYDALTGPGGMAADAYKAQWEFADVIDFGF